MASEGSKSPKNNAISQNSSPELTIFLQEMMDQMVTLSKLSVLDFAFKNADICRPFCNRT